jgi:hypothetical protein
MRRSRRYFFRTGKERRRSGFAGVVAGAVLLCAGFAGGASALDFKCVEASRYKNLLQVFDDNPAVLAAYFGLASNQVPDFNACRALAVTGTIGGGDAEALLNTIIRSRGWLDVLYLSFDGFNLKEELRLAYIIRAFWLKTRVLDGATLRYEPDFATRWGAPAAGANGASEKTSEPLSPLNPGLEAFARRGDLQLPIPNARNLCIESCAGAWAAGVHRRRFPVPPIDVRAPAASSEMVTARPRAALAATLDFGTFPAPNDPGARKLLVPGASPALPPPIDQLVRARCAGELVAGEALEARVGGAADQLARNDFNGVRSTPPALLADLDSLRRAGVRLQRCVARVFEHERLEKFRSLCDPSCDRAKLLASFDQMRSEFVEQQISIAAMLEASAAETPPEKIGREWHQEEPAGSAVWKRREGTGVFDATWPDSAGKSISATIEVARMGNRVIAVRVQPEGRCLYQGLIANGDTAARGTFFCSWIGGAYGWSATIE